MWKALEKMGEEGKKHRDRLLDFFKSHPIIIDMGEAIVAHGSLPRGSTESLLSGTLTNNQQLQALWDRPERNSVREADLVESMKELNKTIFVCGHTPPLGSLAQFSRYPHQSWFYNKNGIIMFSNQCTTHYEVSYTLLDVDSRTITSTMFVTRDLSAAPQTQTHPFP